jgi:hypothetical protein
VRLDPGDRTASPASAIDLIRERGCPAQICVLARGQLVLDEAFGCRAADFFFLFSASKPVVALAMTDWTASVRALEQASPGYPPGQLPAYRVLSYGFILGELVHRVTSASVREPCSVRRSRAAYSVPVARRTRPPDISSARFMIA